MVQYIPSQQANAWRSGNGEQAWLSMLIGTMETISRREIRAVPCDATLLKAVSLHLARPASLPHWHAPRASDFSLRN